MEILLRCGRARLDSAEADRVKALLQGGVDWDYLTRLALRHGLMPLAGGHLLNSFSEFVPAGHLARLREIFMHNAARNLLLVTELCRALEALEAGGAEAVAYKGPALAVQAYGDLNLRSFVDLDVLVRRDDVGRAGRALARLGYRPLLRLTPGQEAMLARSECDRVYLRDGRDLMLELHWAVTPPFFSVPLETERVLAGASVVGLCGRPVRVPAPEVMVLLLCVNGAKDLWISLETVCALGELARRGIDWDSAEELAREVGALRMFRLGLKLSADLLGVPLPPKILDSIAADRQVGKLFEEARGRLLSDESRAPGLLEKTRFRVRARERRRDRLRYLVLRGLTPTYRDCSPELPRSLSFVYYGVRPLRLLRDGLRGKVKGSAAKPVV